jgi:hypothetical protein
VTADVTTFAQRLPARGETILVDQFTRGFSPAAAAQREPQRIRQTYRVLHRHHRGDRSRFEFQLGPDSSLGSLVKVS